MHIFKDTAPRYWARGISVIPLRRMAKVPALNAWSQYATQLPTADQQAQWLEAFADGNIGMALGPHSGIVALDLDSVDPKVEEIIQRLLPVSPWKRVGKKGSVRAYRYNGERTFRIKDEYNNTILELLSKGAQVVLPPSIHPDTQLPYQANCDLIDVLDQLPGLPADVEQQLRQALIAGGFQLNSAGPTRTVDFVPLGARDTEMTRMAGLLARAVLRRERTLPEAFGEMDAWVENFTAKVAGDPVEAGKGRQKILDFLRRDLVEGRGRLPPDWALGLSDEEATRCRVYLGEDAVDWGLARFRQAIADLQDGPAADRNDLADRLLGMLAKAQHLNAIDRETVLRELHQACGDEISKGALRARLKELGQPEFRGDNQTEIARATLADLNRIGQVRFDLGTFYQWSGSHWQQLARETIKKHIAEEFGAYSAAKRSSDHEGIVRIMATLSSAPLTTSDESGVNFANGFLTPELDLQPHDPRWGCTYVLPYAYDPDAGPPDLLLNLLSRCWAGAPDFSERAEALRQAIAATLFGVAPSYQRAFCLFGPAGSGKSTVMEMVESLLPANAVSHIPPHTWGDTFKPAQMAGKRMNVGGDLHEKLLIPGAPFKLIVEGAKIEAQHKNQDIFEFEAGAAQWCASNYLPRSTDSSEGFIRRWLFIRFDQVFTDEEKIPDFAEKLAEERSQIVAWALPSITQLRDQKGYTLPSSHLELQDRTALTNNAVRAFYATSIVQPGPGEVTLVNIYTRYQLYCRANGQYPLSLAKFINATEECQRHFPWTLAEADKGNKAVLRGARLGHAAV